ncbi:helix-turn-helix domain-containing protein [Frankia sp. AiPa1]|uniref:helix-turn-helix domain-containing protein n=1 Tax=Frankia sp. AiPa1 TaxID=573492 RepID=UPI00202AE9AA|nr:helix-turn-helix domain-containing protein [Frankia sp. AiPa1]MCL9758388.1 helix-turn-helix domain-containing protein [Frankia sp. AiPa1]
MGQFPAGLPATLAAELDQLGEEIILAIAQEVPAYARPLEGGFGRGVRRGVDEALGRFLAVVEAGPQREPDLAASRDVYVRLGRGEVRAGRSLDNLLGAYRVGARVSWRRLGQAAASHGVEASGLVSLAEMMFAYIDSISAASAEGYAAEQFTAAGERERLLDRLGEMLLTGAPVEAVAQVAQSGRLSLPRRLAAVLIPGCIPADGFADTSLASAAGARMGAIAGVRQDPSGRENHTGHTGRNSRGARHTAHERDGKDGNDGRAAPDDSGGERASVLRMLHLPDDCPRTVQGTDTWLFLSAAERGPARTALAGRLAGLAAVVGPAVPWAQSAASAARARFARDARAAGRLAAAAAADPLFTDEHLSALLLARDPGLVTDLATRLLAPFDGLPHRTRERLAETLLQWLSLRGQRGLIAERLHIHPQTVRYRVNQLRDLFGPSLEDPDTRFDLELVLRASAASRGARADAIQDGDTTGGDRGGRGVRQAAPAPRSTSHPTAALCLQQSGSADSRDSTT